MISNGNPRGTWFQLTFTIVALAGGSPDRYTAGPVSEGPAHTAVFLLNLGGPQTLAEVRPFLYSLFADPKILLSFVMWALYVAILFIRRSAGLRGRRAAWLASGVFVTMLFVAAANLLGSVHNSAHRFGLK